MRAGVVWAALAAAATPEQAAELRRGAAAVGDRTSAQPALRASPAASPGYAAGAALRGWANAAGAIRFDATHTTGDGGDAEALAEDCTDERLAFAELERRAAAGGVTPAMAEGAGVAAGWQARRAAKPPECR